MKYLCRMIGEFFDAGQSIVIKMEALLEMVSACVAAQEGRFERRAFRKQLCSPRPLNKCFFTREKLRKYSFNI